MTDTSNSLVNSVPGRKARDLMTGETVTIEVYEPFGAGLCDVRVRGTESGMIYWTSLGSNLRPLPGQAAFPSRSEVRRLRDKETLSFLQREKGALEEEIRTGRPWPGAEHGKAILGRAVVGAISDLEDRLGTTRGTT